MLGNKLYKYSEIDSTNEEAKRRVSQGAGEGEVIIADCQTRGRGRFQRKWISRPGGLYFSLILKPFKNPDQLGQITLLAAVAAAEAILEYTGLSVKLKWPNDILISEKKAGGILCELEKGFVIAGVGLNVNQPLNDFPAEIRTNITSFKNEAGKDFELLALSEILLSKVELYYSKYLKTGFKEIRNQWQNFSSTLNRQVKVGGLEGQALGIGEKGELIIKLEDGTIEKVTAGDLNYAT